jgi:hypothetical protein
VAVEGVVSDPLWEKLGLVLGTVGLSAGWVTLDVAICFSLKEPVTVAAAELASVPD